MPEVITIGESMALFTPGETGRLRYVADYRRRLAGAESNVAISLVRLGHSTGWISAVGEDEFGAYILKEIRGEGVDISQAYTDPDHRTGIMFKQISPGQESSIFYYRENSAASHMTPDCINPAYFVGCKILHLTGITLALSKSCRDTLVQAVKVAKAQGAKISFDPNIRLKLWSAQDARAAILPFIRQADLVFPGLDECKLLLGPGAPEEHAQKLLEMGVSTVALKLGEHGALVAGENEMFRLPAHDPGTIVDPVGAGDAFAAGFLAGRLEGLSLAQCGRMGTVMGAMALCSYDDYQSLPDRRQLDMILNGMSNTVYR